MNWICKHSSDQIYCPIFPSQYHFPSAPLLNVVLVYCYLKDRWAGEAWESSNSFHNQTAYVLWSNPLALQRLAQGHVTTVSALGVDPSQGVWPDIHLALPFVPYGLAAPWREILLSFCCDRSLVNRTVTGLTAVKFKPLILLCWASCCLMWQTFRCHNSVCLCCSHTRTEFWNPRAVGGLVLESKKNRNCV
jgi:hypothetical protein